jgi:prophage regulatory protein
MDTGTKFINVSQVSTLVGLSPQTVTRLAKKGVFPKPIRPTQRSVRWDQNLILQWLESRREFPAKESQNEAK